jgi:hypothetical protein
MPQASKSRLISEYQAWFATITPFVTDTTGLLAEQYIIKQDNSLNVSGMRIKTGGSSNNLDLTALFKLIAVCREE